MTVTHLRNKHVPWAVCGEETIFYVDDAPTCLGCAAGAWLASDNEQMRLIEFVSSKIPPALGLPPVFIGYVVTSTSNSIEVKSNEVLQCSSNTIVAV